MPSLDVMNIRRQLILALLSPFALFGVASECSSIADYPYEVIEGDTVHVYPSLFKNILSIKEDVPDGVWVQYYDEKPSQKALVFVIEEGVLQGEIRGYHTNDVKMLLGYYEENEKSGEWTWWNESGQIEAHETWKDGMEDGLWVFYDLNAKKTQEGYYKKGRRHGTWYYYHKDGYLQYEEEYKNGSLTGETVTYTRDGRVNGYGYLNK